MLVDRLEHEGVRFDLIISESGADLADKTRKLAAEYPRIVGAGGDSTFFIIVNALMDTDNRPELGLIGLGSSNDIPLHFGIETVEKACHALKEDRTQYIDLGCISRSNRKTYFLGQANIGIGVAVNRYVAGLADRFPLLGKRQTLAGTLGIIRAYLRKETAFPVKMRVEFGKDGDSADVGVFDGKWTAALFSNICYWATGKLMCPDADAGDGKLDACLIESCSIGRLAGINRKASSGVHKEDPKIHMAQAESYRIFSETPFAVQLDGEILGGAPSPEMTTEAQIDVVPSVFRLIVGQAFQPEMHAKILIPQSA